MSNIECLRTVYEPIYKSHQAFWTKLFSLSKNTRKLLFFIKPYDSDCCYDNEAATWC